MTKALSLVISVILALIGVVGDSFIRRAGAGSRFVDVKWFTMGSVGSSL